MHYLLHTFETKWLKLIFSQSNQTTCNWKHLQLTTKHVVVMLSALTAQLMLFHLWHHINCSRMTLLSLTHQECGPGTLQLKEHSSINAWLITLWEQEKVKVLLLLLMVILFLFHWWFVSYLFNNGAHAEAHVYVALHGQLSNRMYSLTDTAIKWTIAIIRKYSIVQYTC